MKKFCFIALLLCTVFVLCAAQSFAAEVAAEIDFAAPEAPSPEATVPPEVGEKPMALPPRADGINATSVDYVWINISEPTIGGEPDYTPEYGASSKAHSYSESYSSLYYRNDVSWYDKTDGRSLEPDKDTFVQWHEYTVNIYVTAKKGYEYDDATYAYVNGAKVECTLYGDQLHVTYTFPPAGIISEARILWIKPPIAGNTPDYEPTVTDGERYYLADYSSGNTYKNDIVWRDATTNKNIAVTDTFIAGHQYEITVYYTAKEGYAFTGETTGRISPSGGRYFGNTFEAKTGMYLDQLRISYTFPETPKPIPGVSLTCAPPMLGAKPDYNPVLPADANYEICDYNTSEYTHGVWWYDMQTKKVLSASDTFDDPDHEYRIAVWVRPKDGYAIDGPGTINGIGAATSGHSGYPKGEILYCVSYYGTMKEINSVSVKITPPKAGEKPDYNPVLPDGAKYYSANVSDTDMKNDVYWYSTSGARFLEVGTDRFAAGKVYRVIVFLTAKDGYVFSETALATVNGKAAEECRIVDGKLRVKYTFPAAPELITSVSMTITPPKTGAKPDMNPKLPSGAKYHTENPYNASNPAVIWYDSTDSREMDPHKDTFKAGHTYQITMWLMPDEGYMFAEGAQPWTSVKTFLNGEDVGSFRFSEPHSLLINYTFPTPGDVNGDKKVDRLDYVILSRYLAKWPGYASKITDMSRAELDGKPGITAADRRILGRIVAGKG